MSNNSKIVVLIADDEPSTVAMLSSHLRSQGYSVLEASDGDQAWELAHEHLPHLVILDVMMPGMSGWEVCRKIREAVSLAHTGVIMLTGIGETLNEMTSPLYGADAHVDKPFEFGELDRRIKQTLEQRSQGALGRPDRSDDEEATSFAIEDDDLPTLPPADEAPARRKVARPTTPKPLAKTKPQPAAKPAPAKSAAKPAVDKASKKAPATASAVPSKAPAKKAPAMPLNPPTKPAAAKPAPAKPAPAKPAPAKPAPAKPAPAKKAPARKAPAKKAPVKKAAAKPAKKAPAKKAAAKPAKKAPAKKAKKK